MISNADQLLDEKKSRMDLDGLIIDAVIKSVAPRLVPQLRLMEDQPASLQEAKRHRSAQGFLNSARIQHPLATWKAPTHRSQDMCHMCLVMS